MNNNRLTVTTHNALKKFGRISTLFIGSRFGELFPFYYVVEYPKCGGTWVGKMLGTCLDVPFPQFPVLPIGFEAVIHSHTKYNPRLKRVVYLIRDGRDVMVSYYFHRQRGLNTQYRNACLKWMKKVYGKEIDMNDYETYLPRFIESEMETPSITQLNWPDHVNNWSEKPNVVCAKYEDLLTNGSDTLQTICNFISDKPIDKKRIDTAINLYSFKNMTKRNAGEEDRNSFLRKGISGDWKNHFNKESADIFNHYAGDILINQGYESNNNWIKAFKKDIART
ncbi:MAG: sulfotransferase domain-containing protein [Candidatus Aenigmarchaeota archaeon]|nr:sulfotransferase domain-containing protein [Candidatus Aenigmarchaeota archaeon]